MSIFGPAPNTIKPLSKSPKMKKKKYHHNFVGSRYTSSLGSGWSEALRVTDELPELRDNPILDPKPIRRAIVEGSLRPALKTMADLIHLVARQIAGPVEYQWNVHLGAWRRVAVSSFAKTIRVSDLCDAVVADAAARGGADVNTAKLEEFCAVFKAKLWCLEMSILSRFWRVLGCLVFGMSVWMCMSIWNGFWINGVMELEWINETKRSTVRFCCQNVDFAKFWKLKSKIMFSNP